MQTELNQTQIQSQTIQQIQAQNEMPKVSVKAYLKHTENDRIGYDKTNVKIVAVTCLQLVLNDKSKDVCFKSSKETTVEFDLNEFNEFNEIIDIYNKVVTAVTNRYNYFVKHREQLLQEFTRLGVEVKEEFV